MSAICLLYILNLILCSINLGLLESRGASKVKSEWPRGERRVEINGSRGDTREMGAEVIPEAKTEVKAEVI